MAQGSIRENLKGMHTQNLIPIIPNNNSTKHTLVAKRDCMRSMEIPEDFWLDERNLTSSSSALYFTTTIVFNNKLCVLNLIFSSFVANAYYEQVNDKPTWLQMLAARFGQEIF